MVASIVYVIGSLIWGTPAEISGIVIAILSVAALVYLLVAKDPFLIMDNIRKKEETVAE